MKTIVFSSIKGGTGKSSLSILTANFAASAGHRVLVIDLDLQNSLSSYYLDEATSIDRRNIARALLHEDFADNVVTTNYMGVDLVASSFDLIKLRTLGERTLRRLLPSVASEYDFCIIDTAPTYDNLVLNALLAADHIITPAAFSQFDFKAAKFFRDQLAQDSEGAGKWELLFNFYRAARTDNPDNTRNQYDSLFRSEFGDRILPVTVPDSPLVRRSIDMRESISQADSKRNLYTAVEQLARHCGVTSAPRRF